MSQGDVLRWLIAAVLLVSVLGCAVMSWWERRHPSSFDPAVDAADVVGRSAEIGSVDRP